MDASSVRKREYGEKGRWVKYWKRLGSWISPCYGPFSLGGRFETFEPFICLIFPISFSSRGEPRILNQLIRGHTCTILCPTFLWMLTNLVYLWRYYLGCYQCLSIFRYTQQLKIIINVKCIWKVWTTLRQNTSCVSPLESSNVWRCIRK
jgi:hypothetical protein